MCQLGLEDRRVDDIGVDGKSKVCVAGYVYQFSSVAQSCPTLCDLMDCSTPGFPVHQLQELAQTSVLRVGDAIC